MRIKWKALEQPLAPGNVEQAPVIANVDFTCVISCHLMAILWGSAFTEEWLRACKKKQAKLGFDSGIIWLWIPNSGSKLLCLSAFCLPTPREEILVECLTMSQGVVTFFNPLKVPITQFITTHRAHPAGDCAGSWIYLCEQNLGLARKELTGQSANKEEPLRWHIYTSNDSFCLQLHLDNFFFIFKYFFDCVESSFLCLDFSLVVAIRHWAASLLQLQFKGFSLWWLLLLWSISTAACRLQ